MLAVKNFFLPEKRVDSPRFSRMPEALLRSIRRRSMRVKRTKSLVLVSDKRKSEYAIQSSRKVRGRLASRTPEVGSPLINGGRDARRRRRGARARPEDFFVPHWALTSSTAKGRLTPFDVIDIDYLLLTVTAT
ncbi:hypothetical protein EVAR_9136_1 [Eumeta japonica]|uniref:Uncharacterized protein n=1 Tax=Eumeta variegata TaxID=151549 RepID=A0A4C1TW78_EUMVA|nr:hypothetical protein EVAR_9136_1 [Eumeta japonica]